MNVRFGGSRIVDPDHKSDIGKGGDADDYVGYDDDDDGGKR